METKKKGRVVDYLKGIGFAALLIALFYVIQFAIMFVMILVKIISLAVEMNGDLDAVMASYMSIVQSPEFLTTISAVTTAVTALVFGLWYKLQYGRKFMKNCFKGFKGHVLTGKNILVFVLIGIVCYYMALDICSLIRVISPEAMSSFEAMMEGAIGGNAFVSFIFVVLLAPIGEECLFRGLIQKKFMKWMPIVPAIILQAVFFGIFHMNIVQGIYVLVLGLAAGYVTYRCKSVLPAIFIHMVNNIMGSFMELLPESILNIDILWLAMPFIMIGILVLVIKLMPGNLMDVPETENFQAVAVPVMTETSVETSEV